MDTGLLIKKLREYCPFFGKIKMSEYKERLDHYYPEILLDAIYSLEETSPDDIKSNETNNNLMNDIGNYNFDSDDDDSKIIIENFKDVNVPLTHVIGLNNHGNTCYLNAVLQLLYHIVPLKNLLVKKIDLMDDSNITYKIARLFYFLDKRDVSEVDLALKIIVDHMNNIYWGRARRQQDSNEAIFKIFDEFIVSDIQDDLKKLMFITKTKTSKTGTIEDIRDEPNIHILTGLAIDDDKLNTLVKDQFLQTETTPSGSMKTQKPKDVLFISTDRRTFLGTKLDTNIIFYDKLDLFGDNYYLNGVIIHVGDDEGGHYYSLNKIENEWYETNDHNANQRNESYIFSERHMRNAVLFVYIKL